MLLAWGMVWYVCTTMFPLTLWILWDATWAFCSVWNRFVYATGRHIWWLRKGVAGLGKGLRKRTCCWRSNFELSWTKCRKL